MSAPQTQQHSYVWTKIVCNNIRWQAPRTLSMLQGCSWWKIQTFNIISEKIAVDSVLILDHHWQIFCFSYCSHGNKKEKKKHGSLWKTHNGKKYYSSNKMRLVGLMVMEQFVVSAVEQAHGVSDELDKPARSLVVLRPYTTQAASQSNVIINSFIAVKQFSPALHKRNGKIKRWLCVLYGTFSPFSTVCLSGTKRDDFPFFLIEKSSAVAQLPRQCSFYYKSWDLTYFALARIDPWLSHIPIPTPFSLLKKTADLVSEKCMHPSAVATFFASVNRI